jgi:hypothetical protein
MARRTTSPLLLRDIELLSSLHCYSFIKSASLVLNNNKRARVIFGGEGSRAEVVIFFVCDHEVL